MKFIVYSETNASNVATSLGLPEYSYYFVLKSYVPLLQRLGEVIPVSNPCDEVDKIFHQCTNEGVRCVFLSFSPPSRTITTLACPTVSVFAWEFEDIPYEMWGNDESSSWVHVLSKLPGAITHSTYSQKSVRRRMGKAYPVASIPSPVWQTYSSARSPADIKSKSLHLKFSGYLINSNDISWCEIEPYVRWDRKSNQSWLQPDASHAVSDSVQQYPEHAKQKQTLAQQTVNIIKRHFLEWRNDAFGDLWPINNAHTGSQPADELLQISELRKESLPAALRERFYSDQHILQLKGVIYSVVINPEDGRKNHRDIISVFAEAFRDCSDACLLLKLTHSNPDRGLSRLLAEVYRSAPFKCQIVLLASYLEDSSFQSLMDATSFVVNASHGEGQCLPLMEFMSAGIPAIAPNTTAMADYINSNNAFIVKSSREMTSWPQDPRQVLRTFRYQIDPESLFNAYTESYSTTKNPEKYERMAFAATESLKNFCSLDEAETQLRSFLARLEKDGVFRPVPHAGQTEKAGDESN